MFEYKEGDKIRCKKFFKGEFQNFYEGSTYIIDNLFVLVGLNDEIFKPNGRIYIQNSIFHIEEFYDYFYSKKEIRKLKLEKLC